GAYRLAHNNDHWRAAMGDITGLATLSGRTNENQYKQEEFRLIFRALVISAVVIFGIETFLMYLLEYVFTLPKIVVLIVDGTTLVAFLFPLNYFYIVRPMMRHIQEHHRTEQELLKSSEILERFFSITDLLIAYLDTNFTFIRVNQVFAQAEGGHPENYVGKNYFDLHPHPRIQAIFENVVYSGKPYNAYEEPFIAARGSPHELSYWDWSLLPIKDTAGRVIAELLVLTNVTARKKAQTRLLESETRFRAVFDQTFQYIALMDPSGIVQLINQTACEATGLTAEQANSKPLWQLPCWEESPEGIAEIEAAVRSAARGVTVRGQNRIRRIDGRIAILDSTIKPLIDEHGQTSLLIYEARDISEHIRAEEALKHGEAEIKRLYHAEKRAHKLAETLRDAGLALSSSLNTNTVIETLLDHLSKVVPYTSAHVSLLDDADHLVVRLARGEQDWQGDQRLVGQRYEVSELTFLRPLLQNREMISVPDATGIPPSVIIPRPPLARSWLGIPLLAGEQVIGICALEHVSAGFFTPELRNWAHSLTSQAAVAIQNAWLFEQVRDGRERLQALSRRLVEVQERERHYIAQELHDEAGQALASLMVGLRVIERESNDPQAVLARCEELKGIADGVLENLHRLAINLRPTALDHLGLVAALRQHAETIGQRHEITVQFDTVGEIERLPGEVETAVYRIVQEALTNVIRHSHAARVDILLEQRVESLFVIIEDNGVGFDPNRPNTGQLGMLGMRERADMLGASLTIETAPGQGATILLEVPCPSAS
ncbi:MAG TPA: PAS domain S-box protein, partial [Anaerolineaceae bacterium]|nr:PAS domain S-box protein [Anaerolineaceae bacterium]